MRKYGEIDEVSFRYQGYNIYNLDHEYTLSKNGCTKIVYVGTMKALKEEIREFITKGS